jgi:hypothetical protein
VSSQSPREDARLKRLVLDFRSGEVVVRCLYRSSLQGAKLGPNTKARRRQVQDLSREGLRQALASLEGDAELVGCSGFTTREDILVALPRPDESKARDAERAS